METQITNLRLSFFNICLFIANFPLRTIVSVPTNFGIFSFFLKFSTFYFPTFLTHGGKKRQKSQVTT